MMDLIDVSNEDDSLISPAKDPDFLFTSSPASSAVTDLLALEGNVNPEHPVPSTEATDQQTDIRIPAPEEGRKVNAEVKPNKKPNLRKSLAWDKSFFTCEGVLDPDELSLLGPSIMPSQKFFSSSEDQNEKHSDISNLKHQPHQEMLKHLNGQKRSRHGAAQVTAKKPPLAQSIDDFRSICQRDDALALASNNSTAPSAAPKNGGGHKRTKFAHGPFAFPPTAPSSKDSDSTVPYDWQKYNLDRMPNWNTSCMTDSMPVRPNTIDSAMLQSFNEKQTLGYDIKTDQFHSSWKSDHAPQSDVTYNTNSDCNSNASSASMHSQGIMAPPCSVEQSDESSKKLIFKGSPNVAIAENVGCEMREIVTQENQSHLPGVTSNADTTQAYITRPSRLRKPSPKLGFFDSEKYIRTKPSYRHDTNGSSALPPKPIQKESSNVATANTKLKLSGSPWLHTIPSASSSGPAPDTPATAKPALNSVLSRVSKSIESPQVIKLSPANTEVSSLMLLAQKKFGSSPQTKLPSNDHASNLKLSSLASQHESRSYIPPPSIKKDQFTEDRNQVTCTAKQSGRASLKQDKYTENSSKSEMFMSDGTSEDFACQSKMAISLTSRDLISRDGSKLDIPTVNEADSGLTSMRIYGRSPLVDSNNFIPSAQQTFQKPERQQKEDTIIGKENSMPVGEFHTNSETLSEESASVQDKKRPKVTIDPPPFSEEWFASLEAAGEEILLHKGGRVQHSPPDKSDPEPGPWSPVRRNKQLKGPYDCTKYTNPLGSESL